MRIVTEVQVLVVPEGRAHPVPIQWHCRAIEIQEADNLVEGYIILFLDTDTRMGFENRIFHVTQVEEEFPSHWVYVGTCIGKSGKRYFVWVE